MHEVHSVFLTKPVYGVNQHSLVWRVQKYAGISFLPLATVGCLVIHRIDKHLHKIKTVGEFMYQDSTNCADITTNGSLCRDSNSKICLNTQSEVGRLSEDKAVEILPYGGNDLYRGHAPYSGALGNIEANARVLFQAFQ